MAMAATSKLRVQKYSIVGAGELYVYNFHSAWHVSVIKMCHEIITVVKTGVYCLLQLLC